ncbi:MAG: MFS transporter [Spirochaetia bacterium]|nr:MFS transporter [Spirochaetia bacterium]
MNSKFPFYSKLCLLSISYLSLGLILPAMSLIVTSKGFSLPYLGIAMMCMSISVMVFEVPSGILCDAKGRRMSFHLSMIFTFIGTSLLFSSSFFILCIGFALTGIGRAFGSGSLDALLIEETQDSGGNIADTLFSLEIVSSLSLAIGALIGGYLLTLGAAGSFLTHHVLGGRMILIGINIVLIPLLIAKESKKETSHKVSTQVSLLFHGLTHQPQIIAYIVTVVIQGVFLSSIETYWQPYLKKILQNDGELWILGVVASSIFLISILGSWIGKLLLPYISAQKIYIGLFIIDLLLIACLGRTHSVSLFFFLFLLIYILLGALSIAGSTLLNQRLDNSLRSSVLSLSSFSLQGGAILSSLSSVIILSYTNISGFWVIVAVFGIVVLLATYTRM